MKTTLTLAAILCVAQAIAQPKMPNSIIPITRISNQTDDFFGTTVADPYRWLEDDRAAETKTWVDAQNENTNAFLAKIPFRENIKKRLTELWNYEKYSAPFKEGSYTYFFKNDGLQNQSVLYRQKNNAEPEIFLNPNLLSTDGTTSLSGITFSKDGSLCAYQISEGGSDWGKIIVLNALTKKQIGDTLLDIKFSGTSWLGNKGFYYSSYDRPNEGSILSAKTDQHKLFFHTLGESQSNDKLIFGGEKTPRRYIGGGVTEDEQYLVISASVATYGNELYIQKLNTPNAPIVPIVTGFDNEQNVVHTAGNSIYLEPMPMPLTENWW